MKTLLLSGILFVFLIDALAQAPKKGMPRNINMRGYDSFYPAISGDGNSLIFLSNFTDSEEVTMMFTHKISASAWKDPIEMPRTFNLPNLTFEGGYSLNFDGSQMYFTFKKSGGMGGFDIWYCERNGNSWGAPQNLGNSVNSSAHEGMPSISADGQYLYFSRCESMSNQNAGGCEIFVAKRKSSKSWNTPVALPGNINNGGSYSPKILADSETLIFASDRAGGKGGMDLYYTRKEGDQWVDPQKMDFVNTTVDDQFVSVPAKGRYIFHDIKGERGREIELLLIPKEFKPKNTLRITGSASYMSSGQMTPAYLKVYNIDNRERVFYSDISENDKANFNFVLKEGAIYDLSVEPKDGTLPYYSKLYDLQQMRSSTRDELEVMLNPLNSGDSLLLGGIVYENNSMPLSDVSVYELRRLTRFLKNNNSNNFELRIHLKGYRSDTVQSDPMLTEVIIDTVFIEKPLELEELQVDSVNVQVVDSLVVQETDSLAVNFLAVQKTDSLMVADSLAVEDDSAETIEEDPDPEPEPEFIVNYTYHNDRTFAQADVLKLYLIEHDIPESQLTVVVGRKDAQEDEINATVEVYLKKGD